MCISGDVEELGRVLSLSGVDLAHHVVDSTPILHFSIRENQVEHNARIFFVNSIARFLNR